MPAAWSALPRSGCRFACRALRRALPPPAPVARHAPATGARPVHEPLNHLENLTEIYLSLAEAH